MFRTGYQLITALLILYYSYVSSDTGLKKQLLRLDFI
jgi:hypothetical protein